MKYSVNKRNNSGWQVRMNFCNKFLFWVFIVLKIPVFWNTNENTRIFSVQPSFWNIWYTTSVPETWNLYSQCLTKNPPSLP